MNSPDLSVVIAGGGTAGHIEPALAVAEALRERHGARITALGTSKGLERDIIPERGVDLRLITPVPIPRKPSKDLALLPFNIIKSVLETRKVLKQTGAKAVFGTGGYVAAPAYLAAKSMKLPFFVLETNALAGMANKLGVKLGGVGFNANADSGMEGEVVGIPVRPGLDQDKDSAAAQAAYERWNLSPDRPVILVTGGSQGAVSINTAVEGAIEELTQDYQVLHAYGKKNAAPEARDNYTPVPYIEDMAGALAVADLVICRSGAMTVAEVTSAGLPAIYVPLPHGNGEQALNSAALVDAGAAVQIKDNELNPARLVAQVRSIVDDRSNYASMRQAARNNTAGDVANILADKIAAAAAAGRK